MTVLQTAMTVFAMPIQSLELQACWSAARARVCFCLHVWARARHSAVPAPGADCGMTAGCVNEPTPCLLAKRPRNRRSPLRHQAGHSCPRTNSTNSV